MARRASAVVSCAKRRPRSTDRLRMDTRTGPLPVPFPYAIVAAPQRRRAGRINFPSPLGQSTYPVRPEGLATLAVREPPPPDTPKPRLLDRVREALRTRHYSRRTEQAYVAWIRRFIFFHGKRHPAELGAPEVTRFLSALAVEGRVAASTQNQALSALLFLYRNVLAVDLPWLDDVVRAKRPERLPVVLTRDEVRSVLQRFAGPTRLMACLLYGAGLRVLECCRLRVQDVDFGANLIVIRGGKGDKDRRTMLPATVKDDLRRHLDGVRAQHAADLATGAGWSSCRPRWRGSTRGLAASGSGSGCSQPRASTWIGPRESGAGTTCTRPSSSAPSSTRLSRPAWPSGPARTPSDTPSPPICSRTATTSARSRSSWATVT